MPNNVIKFSAQKENRKQIYFNFSIESHILLHVIDFLILITCN